MCKSELHGADAVVKNPHSWPAAVPGRHGWMTRAASLTSSVLSGKRNLVDFLWRRRGSGGRCIQDPDTVVKGPSPYVKVDSYWPTLVVSRYAVRGMYGTPDKENLAIDAG